MKIMIAGSPVWINYHHLYCFYMIATEGSLMRASEKLGIGASALSIQMKQFEKNIGFALFERVDRRILPNERGKIIIAYAKEIFRLGSEMVETIYDQPTANRTHLQIGVLDTIPKHLTVQLVEKALEGLRCTVSVIEGKSAALFDDLVEHKIDLMLSNFMPQFEPGKIFCRRIAKLPLWVVGGRSFLKLKKQFPESLDGQPFVIPTGDSRARHEFDHFCKHADIVPDYLAETQDLMVQKLLALKQLGLTVMPEFAVREYLDKKELFLIGPLPRVYEEIFLISASRKIENPVASFLMSKFHLI